MSKIDFEYLSKYFELELHIVLKVYEIMLYSRQIIYIEEILQLIKDLNISLEQLNSFLPLCKSGFDISQILLNIKRFSSNKRIKTT